MSDRHLRIQPLDAQNVPVRASEEPYVACPEREGAAVPLVLTREVRACDPDDRAQQ
jgi:hypothetical protein